MSQPQFNIRLDPTTKEVIQKAAAAEGLTIAAFFRYSALKEARSILSVRHKVSPQDKISEASEKEAVTS